MRIQCRTAGAGGDSIHSLDMLGLLILFSIALALIFVILTAVIVWEARRPPRHTAGYAVAKGLACDPGELGLEYQAWQLDLGNGVRLPVWEIAPPDRAEASSPSTCADASLTIVFIHGWGHSRIDMLQRIDPWKNLCDRIVLYDLRGHGEAEGSLTPLGQGEDADLLALLERLGGGRFVLVGHSMGAVIAIQAAVREEAIADRIAGIVAYGLYADYHTSIKGRLVKAGIPGRPLTDLAILWLRLRGIRLRGIERDVKRLRCPLLVIHGTADEIVPISQAKRMVELAPKGRLHAVEGAGHLDAHEIDETSHDDAVREFMDKLKGATLHLEE